MSIQINSAEVLKHLHNYGITSVDNEALKLFIKDLKKLIKYELRKNSENVSPESNEIVSKKLDTFIPVECRSSSPSRCEPAYHCGRIPSCDCHSQKSIQPSDPVTTSVPEKSKDLDITSSNKPTKEKPVEAKTPKVSPKAKEPVEPVCRPASLMSHTRSHSGGRTRKSSRDPVELYHYYQSIWKKHTLPGENDHAQLRRSIRDKLMNVK